MSMCWFWVVSSCTAKHPFLWAKSNLRSLLNEAFATTTACFIKKYLKYKCNSVHFSTSVFYLNHFKPFSLWFNKKTLKQILGRPTLSKTSPVSLMWRFLSHPLSLPFSYFLYNILLAPGYFDVNVVVGVVPTFVVITTLGSKCNNARKRGNKKSPEKKKRN